LSGIVGIYQPDGAPVERPLLQSLVGSLAYRGPDGCEMWLDGPVGLGHAQLRTTWESRDEKQPANLDGRFWVAADARLDAREDLVANLHDSGQRVAANLSDAELILHSYAAWGMGCVEKLLGDFAFAIWDAHNRQLFCARDHFGIKPFYYSQPGGVFLCSNTLHCIRLHPRVTDELNDTAVGDFLLFGLNCDNATTIFQDVQRLPPAHTLAVSLRGLQVKRYWAPPTDGRIRYAYPREYVETFHSILEKAVADRLRTDRVGILLSGGLDSSSVAAVAKEVSARESLRCEIRGYTYVYESLIADREGDYAREVGRFLRIPVKVVAMDDAQLFEHWDDSRSSWPEPIDNPFLAVMSDAYRDISADCRVLFSGEGSDNLMDFQMGPYVEDLWRQREWRRLVTEVANYLWVRPFPWRGIRARALRLIGKDLGQSVYPNWLAPEFSSRTHLAERWKEQSKLGKSWVAHPIHPRGHGSLALPQWTHMFEQENPGATGCPVETRYPFLDLRMVNYLLAIPPFPWFFKKMLLRETMTGRLPDRVRTRPKTPLQGDPTLAQIQRTGDGKLKTMPLSAKLNRYVDPSALVMPHARMSEEQLIVSLRPYCFNTWLQSARRIRYNICAEARNG